MLLPEVDGLLDPRTTMDTDIIWYVTTHYITDCNHA